MQTPWNSCFMLDSYLVLSSAMMMERICSSQTISWFSMDYIAQLSRRNRKYFVLYNNIQKSNETGNAVHEPTMLLPPLHMAVRLTSALASVQVWICYAIGESIWSEVMFVRCVTKLDQQKYEQCCAIKFWVKLGESATVAYGDYPRHKFSDGTGPF
jgi:hypothetical protein